jgi:putative transcriptional regulator
MMKDKNKRNLFEELKEGLGEIQEHKAGKITLRMQRVEKKPRPHVDAALIRNLRDKFNMSRSVFALKLRVSLRTLEKWEQV